MFYTNNQASNLYRADGKELMLPLFINAFIILHQNIFQNRVSLQNYEYSLRNTLNKILLPKPETNFKRNSFLYTSAILFNSLPNEIRSITVLTTFKEKINKYNLVWVEILLTMCLYSVNFLYNDLIFWTSFKCFMYVLHLIVCYSTYRINWGFFPTHFSILNLNLNLLSNV